MQDVAFMELIAKSQLMHYSFDLRSTTFSAEQSSDIVGWLIEQFSMDRCAFLASAAARLIGRDHYVVLSHDDGRIAHAALAIVPQFDPDLRGDGVDIFGRRPLRQIVSEFKSLSGASNINVGELIDPEDFAAEEEQTIVQLLFELPWFCKAVRHEVRSPDGERLQRIKDELSLIWANDVKNRSLEF